MPYMPNALTDILLGFGIIFHNSSSRWQAATSLTDFDSEQTRISVGGLNEGFVYLRDGGKCLWGLGSVRR
ncbi:hypothetical protein DPEC_G00264310 [Dallia pectoralis]|uniref:Uncharacterized protein n=1 Tax=Dallia pectoralis TaxID=75939 RepID=A0ACC2FSG0_DALPE|nr:hypothetical protein DPEC_G00264310 [Dallia pectoralis]